MPGCAQDVFKGAYKDRVRTEPPNKVSLRARRMHFAELKITAKSKRRRTGSTPRQTARFRRQHETAPEISRTGRAGEPPVLGGLVARRQFVIHGEGIAHSHLTFSYDARSCASVLTVQVSEVTLLRSMMILRCSADLL